MQPYYVCSNQSLTMMQSRPFGARPLGGALYAGQCVTVAQLDADPANRLATTFAPLLSAPIHAGAFVARCMLYVAHFSSPTYSSSSLALCLVVRRLFVDEANIEIALIGIISVVLRAPQEEMPWYEQRADTSRFFHEEFNGTDELIGQNETVISVLLPSSHKWNDMGKIACY